MPETSQADKFKDLAREADADEDEAAFDVALGRIARARPAAATPPQQPPFKPK